MADTEAKSVRRRRLPSLTSLRAFEAAARRMSFTSAAEELYVTQGAISRQVKALEEWLSVDLFHRHSRSLELTEIGKTYFDSLRDAFNMMESATLRLGTNSNDRVLTLSVLPTFAMKWMIPRLAKFNMIHPSIEIHMVTSIKPADFSNDIDAAIRVGTREPTGLDSGEARIELIMVESWTSVEADCLIPDVIVPVCSPSLLADGPPLRKPEDLRHQILLHTSTRPHAWEDWLRATMVRDIDHAAGPRFGHFFMALQAAIQGKGVACVPTVLLEDDLVSGRLVVPFAQSAKSIGSYYLIYRRQEREQPKIAAFRQWLLEEAANINFGLADLTPTRAVPQRPSRKN